MTTSKEADKFIEHYGVKGMKKPVSPKKLDRVYRVANGTSILADRIQKARKTTDKAIADAEKQSKVVAEAQAKALLEKTTVTLTPPDKNQDTTDPKEDADNGEEEVKKLLKQCGATKISDLV